ncbi:MAG: hypothetical protein IH944_03600 [Armatimonadetes bacterium]|nr:hypothetical protein [Armatimonadota bacterium]
MMSELTSFVHESLKEGCSRDEIRRALDAAGWTGDEVDAALQQYSDVSFAVPVPRAKQFGTAKEAFLYLATFVAMYMSAIALGGLAIALIEYLVPSPEGNEWTVGREELFWYVAMAIVALPIYLGLARSHLRAYATDAARRASGARRLMTYLTLFVAFVVMLTRLISIVQQAFLGEMVASTLLKSLAVIAIAAAVYFYYQWELRIGGPTASEE